MSFVAFVNGLVLIILAGVAAGIAIAIPPTSGLFPITAVLIGLCGVLVRCIVRVDVGGHVHRIDSDDWARWDARRYTEPARPENGERHTLRILRRHQRRGKPRPDNRFIGMADCGLNVLRTFSAQVQPVSRLKRKPASQPSRG